MKDKLDILFGETPGELSPKESELKAILGELKGLNSNVPELQLSEERLRDAILSASRPKVAHWYRPFMVFVPLAASVVVVAMLYTNQKPGNPKVDSSVSTVAKAIPAHDVEAGVPEPEPINWGADGPYSLASDAPKNRINKPKPVTQPVKRVRRAPRTHLVAMRMEKAISVMQGAVVRSTPANLVPTISVDMNLVPKASKAVEPIVIVTSMVEPTSNSLGAIEVSKQDDVVIGS